MVGINERRAAAAETDRAAKEVRERETEVRQQKISGLRQARLEKEAAEQELPPEKPKKRTRKPKSVG